MSDDVTRWICQLAEGDELAAQRIWERYYQDLTRLARKKLEGVPRRAADEEDVVLSAMNSFYRGAAAGRFPQLNDREDLWKLLVTITARKATAQRRRHHAQKRGANQVRGESVFLRREPLDRECGIEQVLGEEPTPEFAAMVAETFTELLDSLDDDTLKAIVLDKMEGFSNEEIAQKLGCVRRTIDRKLARIRDEWTGEG